VGGTRGLHHLNLLEHLLYMQELEDIMNRKIWLILALFLVGCVALLVAVVLGAFLLLFASKAGGF